jgi:hypothetical protein
MVQKGPAKMRVKSITTSPVNGPVFKGVFSIIHLERSRFKGYGLPFKRTIVLRLGNLLNPSNHFHIEYLTRRVIASFFEYLQAD